MREGVEERVTTEGERVACREKDEGRKVTISNRATTSLYPERGANDWVGRKCGGTRGDESGVQEGG